MKYLTYVVSIYLLLTYFLCINAQGAAPKFKKESLVKSLEDSTQNTKLRKKSPTGALLRSMVFPGWGQWYNEQKIKAAVVFTAEGFLIGFAVYLNKKVTDSEPGSSERIFYTDRRNLTYWLIGGVTLLSMLDAYVDAYLYDFDTGPDLALRIGTLPASSNPVETSRIVGLAIRAEF